MKKEKLQAIAAELNELLGLDPAINIDGKTASMRANIQEAVEMLEPEDEITKETLAGLKELGFPTGKQEIEDDDVEEVIVEEMEIDLVKEIEGADRIQDLRNIVKAYKEFKNIRGSLTKWKTVMSLKDVMLDVLEDEDKDEKVIPVKTEMKVVEKEVVKGEKEILEKTKGKGKKLHDKKTRIEIVTEVIIAHKGKTLTIDEIVQKADKQNNISNIKETTSQLQKAIMVLTVLDLIKKENNAIHISKW